MFTGNLANEGVSGESDDSNQTEEDADHVEEDAELAWLRTSLRVPTCRSAVDTGGCWPHVLLNPLTTGNSLEEALPSLWYDHLLSSLVVC